MNDPLENFLSRLKAPRQPRSGQWEARCPAHDDQHASLGISRGDDGRVLVKCLAGCSVQAVVKAVGLRMFDLFTETERKRRKSATRDESRSEPATSPARGKIVAEYDYTDAAGKLLYQVVRFDPKDFRQRRPDGVGGWVWKVNKAERVLYRLPDITKSPVDAWVFIVEGEKDADRLVEAGLIATCNPGGALKWRQLGDDSVLTNRRVAIIPDKDPPGADGEPGPGERHATDVAERIHGRAATVRILRLPGPGKDAYDWIEAGGQANELLALAEATADWKPGADHTADTFGKYRLGEIDDDSGGVILSVDRTLPTARAFVREHYKHPDGRTIQHFASMLYRWENGRYVEHEDGAVKNQLSDWLHDAKRVAFNAKNEEYELRPFPANPRTINAALDAIRAFAHLPATGDLPRWLAGSNRPSATELLVCKSCILHLPTITDNASLPGAGRMPSTPALFSTNALEFDHDPSAPEPFTWNRFLGELFGDDDEAHRLLQEWFGYCLTPDTSQQKILLIIGPKRAGKGTIARVLRRLVGTRNVAGPTTTSLAGPFGLQPLLDKTLAIVSDARFSGDNIQTVIERLLCISGEDAITVDRKQLTSVTLKLQTRFVLLTNPIPKMPDAAGAITGRFLVLRLTQTFFGREDPALMDKLDAELPGILNWSIAGWRSLRDRGRFIQPASSADVIEDLDSLASPVGAFVRDRCQLGEDCRIYVTDLYDEWVKWCKEDGRERPTTKQWFGRDLQAACPTVRCKASTNGLRFYDGIDLKQGNLL